MRHRRGRSVRLALIGMLLAVAACADSGSPATTPVVTTPPEPTTIPATTATPPTTLASTTTTTTTTLATTTTTTSPPPTTTVDRIAEVQAIVQDLEERRLDALFREDEEAFRALFANDAYLELSLEVLGDLDFVAEPSDIEVEVRAVLADLEDCLAVEVFSDLTQALGPDARVTQILVLEKVADEWGFSYGGTGWVCSGPHPLER